MRYILMYMVAHCTFCPGEADTITWRQETLHFEANNDNDAAARAQLLVTAFTPKHHPELAPKDIRLEKLTSVPLTLK